MNFLSAAVLILMSLNAHSALAPAQSTATGPFGKTPLLQPTTAAVATPVKQSAPSKPNSITFSCSDLRRTALNMSVHASNMANRSTSRTPEGGPYKPMEVVCKAAGGAFCSIEKVEKVRVVHQPGHPDADTDGNVKLPDINIGAESAGLNSAASELKMMAGQGACGTKTIEQDLLTVVKYHADFEVMMDTMTFTNEGRLARWSRTTRDGKTQNLTFKDDGTPIGF